MGLHTNKTNKKIYKFSIKQWFVDKTGESKDFTGEIIKETEKAYLLLRYFENNTAAVERWYPKSVFENISFENISKEGVK